MRIDAEDSDAAVEVDVAVDADDVADAVVFDGAVDAVSVEDAEADATEGDAPVDTARSDETALETRCKPTRCPGNNLRRRGRTSATIVETRLITSIFLLAPKG
jgi:hypothetical protein